MKYETLAVTFQIISWIGALAVLAGQVGNTHFKRLDDKENSAQAVLDKEIAAKQIETLLKKVEPIEEIAQKMYPLASTDAALYSLLAKLEESVSDRHLRREQQLALVANLREIGPLTLEFICLQASLKLIDSGRSSTG